MSRRLLAVGVLGAVLAGCGEPEPPRPLRPVQLRVTEPADGATVQSGVVRIRGRVRPAASEVRVAGVSATVGRDGRWSAQAELEPGANVVDVTAAASGRKPALVALRVLREIPVRVPDLIGREPQDAQAELERLGLKARLTEGGGLLDDLLPGDPQVCASDPEAGAEVRPGSTVTLESAKVC
jgi:hypothetical protein